jgi:hypothetical protein
MVELNDRLQLVGGIVHVLHDGARRIGDADEVARRTRTIIKFYLYSKVRVKNGTTNSIWQSAKLSD